MLSLLIARISVSFSRVAPYAFLDLMRDNGMIPSEQPRLVHRTTTAATDQFHWAGLWNWFSSRDYDFVDLVMDGLRAKAAMQTNITEQPQADIVRLRHHERTIRRRSREPLRAESWLAAA